MADDAGNSTRPVSDICQAVRPGLKQNEAKGIRAARQGKQVDAGKEIAFLRLSEDAEAADAIGKGTTFPEALKVGHLWAGKHQLKVVAFGPGNLCCSQ